MKPPATAFWSKETPALMRELGSGPEGLPPEEAEERAKQIVPHRARRSGAWHVILEFLFQFSNPIILILICAAIISAALNDTSDAIIILGIVLISGILGFWQEHRASLAVEKLLSMVKITARVLRGGRETDVQVESVVPGDIVLLAAGDVIPGDCLLIQSKDLFVDEAVLTGETFPVEKAPGVFPPETPLAKRQNSLFMGTHVVSGTAKAVIALAGGATEFGRISARLKLRPPRTDFQRGVLRFGYLLMEVTLMLVIAIFAINVHFDRPVLEAFLFALALAVGLTPQLLPAVITVNLAHGARAMAAAKVIVKRLDAIENFGSMNVLCSDKTGTLTRAVVNLHAALGFDGEPSEKVLLYAYLNASFETGFVNPIDKAIRALEVADVGEVEKLDEVPYDFIRKRLSILVARNGERLLISKGALPSILQTCTHCEIDGHVHPIEEHSAAIHGNFERYLGEGYRVLGVAYRKTGEQSTITRVDEKGMTFLGFLLFLDPPKEGAREAVERLQQLHVSLKIITGDSAQVAANVSQQIGLHRPRILTGEELDRLSDEALTQRVTETDVFAEIEPNEKERIIIALRRAGYVVGYMGDGINDAAALHAADVSISVDTAVDVAKEAADIVLIERNLWVLIAGVEHGRRTFANTLKYVFMATSANFGNMFSMAAASVFLPFLPLLPKQILTANVLTDLPEMAIATDNVSRDSIESPRRWNLTFIRRFMITFGMVSSIFDFVTFGILLWVLHADPTEFRTGWFVESVVSAAMIVLVVRARGPFYTNRPSTPLLLATIAVILFAFLLPYLPWAHYLGFQPLPLPFLASVVVITSLYVAAAEVAKKIFYKYVSI